MISLSKPRPRLRKRTPPGHVHALWSCVLQGHCTFGLTAKEAYNKMAARWNQEFNWAPEVQMPLAL